MKKGKMERLTVIGKKGRRYEVHTSNYGDRNVEIVLTYRNIIVAAIIRPLWEKGCNTGFEAIIDQADAAVEKLGLRKEG